MSDQLPRARRLSELGLVKMIKPNELNSNTLTEAILTQIDRSFPPHSINLDGDSRTVEFLEKIYS